MRSTWRSAPEGAIAALCFCSAALNAQGAPARWELSLGARLATPDGWVQVREGQIEGTRLHFRPDLGVTRMHAYELGVAYRPSSRTMFRLSLESNALNGTVTLPRDVLFNGATLAGGTQLATRTDFPHFARVTLAGERRLLRLGEGGALSGTAGLTFVLLTFELHGTLAPSTAGHETKEDFVTQELPVPLIGARLDYPIARRLSVISAVDGGFLPWVNSLRKEGGTVSLKQSHLDFDVGLGYALTPALRLEAAYHGTRFAQFESSHEDGNDIRLGENGVRVGVVWSH